MNQPINQSIYLSAIARPAALLCFCDESVEEVVVDATLDVHSACTQTDLALVREGRPAGRDISRSLLGSAQNITFPILYY